VNRSARKLSWLLVSARAARELPSLPQAKERLPRMPEEYFRAREQLLGTAEGLQHLARVPPEEPINSISYGSSFATLPVTWRRQFQTDGLVLNLNPWPVLRHARAAR
jgi:hypothetical protein